MKNFIFPKISSPTRRRKTRRIFGGIREVVEELTGTPPMTVEAFIRKHAAVFAD